MRPRDDLWKAPVPPSLSALAVALTEFFESTELMSLLIKGRWGCGKTAGLRSVLKHLEEETFFPTSYSFVSLSGKVDLSDERQLLARGLRHTKAKGKKLVHDVAKVVADCGKLIAKIPGVGDAGGATTKAGADWLGSLMLSQMQDGALVVLDDLERRDPRTKIEEVFGCVIRLTENYNCRVIVVCHTDRLPEADKHALAEQRDKVFDLEYLFEPPLAENLEAIVPNNEHRALIESALLAVESPNLRTAAKLNASLHRFEPKLVDLPPRVIQAALRSLVVQGTHKWVVGSEVEPEKFKLACAFRGIRQNAEDRREVPGSLIALTRATNATESPFDEIVARWLREGRFDEAQLAAVRLTAQEMDEVQVALDSISALQAHLRDSFQPPPAELVRRVAERIEQQAGRIPLASFQLALHVLGWAQFDVPTAALERKWAESVLLQQDDFIEEDALKDRRAMEILTARFEEQGTPKDDHARFMDFLGSARVLPPAHRPKEFSDAEWIYRQLMHPSSNMLLSRVRSMFDAYGRRIRADLGQSPDPEEVSSRDRAIEILGAFKKALERIKGDGGFPGIQAGYLLSALPDLTLLQPPVTPETPND